MERSPKANGYGVVPTGTPNWSDAMGVSHGELHLL